MIYLDNAATTKVRKEVLDEMLPYFSEYFTNPSSIYSPSRMVSKKVEEARSVIASTIGASKDEIYFTSGGSESDNWAIKKIMIGRMNKGKHLITTKVEHHAILESAKYLEELGFEVTYLNVDKDGLISLEELENAIRPDTIMVSVMAANNEIGTVMPLKEIGEICKKHGVIFHTDAVQAYGNEKIDVNEMNIDLMSTSAHKIEGPKGIGFLYVRKGVMIKPLINGGSQEKGKRAGTTNAASIVGFAKAALIKFNEMEENNKYVLSLREHLIDRVLNEIPYSILNGSRDKRLANNANFSFRFIEGEGMLLKLDAKGICASSGSACTSGSLDPSHVLLAIGLPHEIAHGSLRITLNHSNTLEEVDYTVDTLKEIISDLRSMSPLYEDFVKKGEK
ncbi:MAG: cysteine desulfurase NifS [Tenericutes bacterium]|nr:cysteine desulfurase NifS [Mycoplasmatota bacterium]